METTTQERTNTELVTKPLISEEFKNNFNEIIVPPLSNGLMGFSAIFSLIIFAKLFGYIIGTNDSFVVLYMDVIYSLTGFLLGAGSKFLEFFGKE
ncbi:MAG: hypothetical protein CR986_01735 [Ignavibacteriae bacterium]|nr:MAG: hypothetical protein CR986_01735 [Ignavibacteriota bacterium]